MLKKITSVLTLFLLLILIFSFNNAAAEKIVIEDYQAELVEIDTPVERIICMSPAMIEILIILGGEEKVVARTEMDADLLSSAQDIPVVGSSSNRPQIEAVLELEPDLIIADTMLSDRNRKVFESFGIDVVVESTSDPDRLNQVIDNFALILDNSEKAEELKAFMSEYEELIENRLAAVEREQRPLVYWEWRGKFRTGTSKATVDPLIDFAGGINIAHDLEGSYPVVSSEFVWEENPDVIIKMASRDDSLADMQNSRDELMNRNALKDTKAVKADRVHIISWDVQNGIFSIIGKLYYAKFFQPDIFADIDPGLVREEMLKRFFEQEEFDIAVYPND